MAIQKGKEIPVVYAGKRKRWHIQIVGPPAIVYQYWPADNNSLPIGGSGQSGLFSSIQEMAVIRRQPYYRMDMNPNDKNFCSERIAAFTIDHFEDELVFFVYPKIVIYQMGNHVKDSDWEIVKKGYGLKTRYEVSPMPLSPISEETSKIIEGTIKTISVKDILINKVPIIADTTYTEYNRFEIMDFD